jgi:hypothetical protein
MHRRIRRRGRHIRLTGRSRHTLLHSPVLRGTVHLLSVAQDQSMPENPFDAGQGCDARWIGEISGSRWESNLSLYGMFYHEWIHCLGRNQLCQDW